MTRPLLPEHVAHLAAHAIPAEVAEAAGCFSVSRPDGLPAGFWWDGTGVVYLQHPLTGAPVPQYRPDSPTLGADGKAKQKYQFLPGSAPLNIVPTMRDRIDTAEVVLVVEGTKQTLAAVAHAGPKVLVVGISGCWNFSQDGIPDPELGHLGIEGRPVVVAFDADIASNPTVHAAGARLAEHLDLLGATKVSFVSIPASATTGLDDYLATVPQPAAVLARLIAKAGKLPRRPKAAAGNGAEFFDQNGLRVVDVMKAVRGSGDFAVGPDGAVWRYEDGVFTDGGRLVGALGDLLGNRYRPLHRKAVEELLADDLRSDGLVLGDTETPGLVNVRNGMLRIATGELEPHDPAHLSRCQLPMDWNPAATCPLFDVWLTDRCGAQAADLLEAAGLMLCPWIGQRRVVFLFGPTRSGKSTFLRLLEAVAGRHRVAVTMHALSANRFAAAALYGAILNVAGDLSDHHVDDLSIFK